MAVFFMHNHEPGIELLLARLQVTSGSRLDAESLPTYLIRWGTTLKEPDSIPTLNRLSAVLRAMRISERNETLNRHGLKTGNLSLTDSQGKENAERTYTTLYWIPVFHMEALAVYEKSLVEPLLLSSRIDRNVGYRELGRPRNGYHVLRAMKTAVRSVYALGLDYALVQIGIHPVGGTFVLDVRPQPKLTTKLAVLFAGAMNRFAREEEAGRRLNAPLLLGADPEFILRSPNGKVIPASRFMDKSGNVGCDAVVLRGRRLIHPLVEIRPEPAETPGKLLDNIHSGLVQAKDLIADDALEWLSGGMPVKGIPLGGHIHFSGIWLHSGLVRKLDNYLTLPAALLEDKGSHQRRPLYGYLGDCRRKLHGGFEYRTLPSWLLSPEITAGVLTLAFLLAENYRYLRQEPLAESRVQQAFYRGNRKELLNVVAPLWKELEELPAYSAHSKQLDALKQVLFAASAPDSSLDFRRNWKL
ncbi:putative amidoligase domain-containing protein [Paenibacillus senegalensis]|uniref:putative amidoligase domain-containing protein n=1 Tax=Paenibacillus senegalensis TaxID=1465766 RepID=UPI000289DC3F|nr:hypothetical protein [Paenibacillus senegalensis]